MESDIKTTTKTYLVLNEDEKEWLKGLVQNPIRPYDAGPEVESSEDSVMRTRFWNALSK